MRSLKLKNFIKRHKDLFWYTPELEKENVSAELLQENILNYTDLPTIKEYFQIVGTQKIRVTFNKLKRRKKGNLYPEIQNLFALYLSQNASRNF